MFFDKSAYTTSKGVLDGRINDGLLSEGAYNWNKKKNVTKPAIVVLIEIRFLFTGS